MGWGIAPTTSREGVARGPSGLRQPCRQTNCPGFRCRASWSVRRCRRVFEIRRGCRRSIWDSLPPPSSSVWSESPTDCGNRAGKLFGLDAYADLEDLWSARGTRAGNVWPGFPTDCGMRVRRLLGRRHAGGESARDLLAYTAHNLQDACAGRPRRIGTTVQADDLASILMRISWLFGRRAARHPCRQTTSIRMQMWKPTGSRGAGGESSRCAEVPLGNPAYLGGACTVQADDLALLRMQMWGLPGRRDAGAESSR